MTHRLAPLDKELVLMWVVTLIDAKVSAGIIASKISALKWMCDIYAKPYGLDAKSVSRMLGVAHRGNTHLCTRESQTGRP